MTADSTPRPRARPSRVVAGLSTPAGHHHTMNGRAITAAMVKPVVMEVRGVSVAMRVPMRMYTAHRPPASRAKPRPTAAVDHTAPEMTTTPTVARASAAQSRADRDPRAATSTGPRNSTATAVPRGRRAMDS